MNINILIGTLESKIEIIFRQLIFQDLSGGRNITHFPGLDGIGGTEVLSYELSKKQLNYCLMNLPIKAKEKENWFFSGLGCSLFAEELIKEYPHFNYYFLKNSNTQVSKDTIQKILDTTETTESWVIEAEFKIINALDNLTKKLNLNWIPLAESKFFVDITTNKLSSDLLISKYTTK